MIQLLMDHRAFQSHRIWSCSLIIPKYKQPLYGAGWARGARGSPTDRPNPCYARWC